MNALNRPKPLRLGGPFSLDSDLWEPPSDALLAELERYVHTMAIRCKFILDSRTHHLQSVYASPGNYDIKEVQSFKFRVVTSHDDPEDKAFFQSTPIGSLELGIVNPEAVKDLHLGKKYYLTLTPVEDES